MIHAIPAQARRGWVLPTLAVAAVMGVALGRFTLAGGGIAPPLSLRPGGGGAEAAIGDLQARLGATPDDPTLLTRLGEAYLLRARETADPSWFTMAGQALDRSQALAPDRPATLTGLGLLALSRHDFSAALALGLRAPPSIGCARSRLRRRLGSRPSSPMRSHEPSGRRGAESSWCPPPSDLSG